MLTVPARSRLGSCCIPVCSLRTSRTGARPTTNRSISKESRCRLARRCSQCLGNDRPGLARTAQSLAGGLTHLALRSLVALPALLSCLLSPEVRVIANDPAHCLPRRLCIDYPTPGAVLAERFAPAVQVGLPSGSAARRCLDSALTLRCTCGLPWWVVQDHDIAVVGELDPCELARGLLHDQRIGSSRHGQHNVEGLSSDVRTGSM